MYSLWKLANMQHPSMKSIEVWLHIMSHIDSFLNFIKLFLIDPETAQSLNHWDPQIL